MKSDTGDNRSIETSFLKVRGNCLEIENTTIQLSNISLLSTENMQTKRFPALSVIIILIGVCFITRFTVPAVIGILAGIGWIGFWHSANEELKSLKRLTIVTNSGHIFPIVFRDSAFLREVVTLLTDIIRDPIHTKNVTINVRDCSFMDESNVIETLQEH